MVTDKTVFEQIVAVLSAGEAAFRVIEHPAEGRCEAVAALRGTEPGQGAKALVCQTRIDGEKHYILAADRQADLQRLAAALGGKKASLVSPAEIVTLTACVPGAIPPFSFHSQLKLVADPELFDRYDEIAFNAGDLERSVVLNAQDYLRIATPEFIHFARTETMAE
ncbi:YbaK/prolyl-tRNA synthetase associated domain-containing protein [Serratia marcescens]|uniref:YbaK/prolyl-tRNA synthetase associated domain-containing protein n=1 Tax=Serratia marcescens TaxID=615 RepID=UPI0011E683F5|nr:YbaK/prolyl-tRNA synthetase associated domain-containing protein [Serratia marcescens]